MGFRGRRWDDGAAAVEFALILPLLVLLLFGIIEFSLAYNRSQGLQAAAREGARVAALARPEAAVIGAIENTLPATVRAADVAIVVDSPGGPFVTGGTPARPTSQTWCATGAGNDATVRIDVRTVGDRYRPSIPQIPPFTFFISDDFSLGANATYRCEVLS